MATVGMILAVIAIMMSSFLMGCYLTDRGLPVRNNNSTSEEDAELARRLLDKLIGQDEDDETEEE